MCVYKCFQMTLNITFPYTIWVYGKLVCLIIIIFLKVFFFCVFDVSNPGMYLLFTRWTCLVFLALLIVTCFSCKIFSPYMDNRNKLIFNKVLPSYDVVFTKKLVDSSKPLWSRLNWILDFFMCISSEVSNTCVFFLKPYIEILYWVHIGC